jgi:hypothetical protein
LPDTSAEYRQETCYSILKVLADLKSPKSKLARPEGQTSNSLLETLVDWTAYLEARDDRPACSHAKPVTAVSCDYFTARADGASA